jgi:hypothetical protein
MLQASVSTTCYIPRHSPLRCHHLLSRVHNLHPAGVHNTRCATQCLARPRVTPSSLSSGGFCQLESCECTCSVSNNAKRHRSSQSIRGSMLVQIDVQEPTISVCRVPYARASGFELIAKLPPPCHFSAHDASCVRACQRFRYIDSSSRSVIGFLSLLLYVHQMLIARGSQ